MSRYDWSKSSEMMPGRETLLFIHRPQHYGERVDLGTRLKGFLTQSTGERAKLPDQSDWWRHTLLRLMLIALLLTVTATRAQAQAVLEEIGTGSSLTSTTTTTITTANDAAAGSSIVVSVALLSVENGSVSASDNAAPNNTYAVEADTRGTTVRTIILAVHVASALRSGGIITITHPTAAKTFACAVEILGLALNPLNRVSTSTGMGTTPSSGVTTMTSYPNQVLLGAIGQSVTVPTTFTPGAGYALRSQETSAADGGIQVESQFVNSIGRFQADGTFSHPASWAAAMTTYGIAYSTIVRLGLLSAQGVSGGTEVLWETVSEFDIAGFNILRYTSDSLLPTQINRSLIPARSSGSLSGMRYTFLDKTMTHWGRYHYQIELVLLDGSTDLIGPVTVMVKPWTRVNPNRLEYVESRRH